MSKKMFDIVIFNPPYQIEAPGTSTSDKPVYHKFLDASYKVANVTEAITPARFLFDAGATPSEWNKKMLNDPHFKVLFFEQDSSKVFSGTDIKGGVAITYRDANKNFDSIKVFTPYNELNTILKKVLPVTRNGLNEIIYTQNKFNLEVLNNDLPGLNRKDKRLESNIFKLSVFKRERTNQNDLEIIGLNKMKREKRFINKKYIDMSHENISKYKVILPKSNGSGAIGETLSTPLIGSPLIGYTRTFIGIGSFDTRQEAENCMKYVKSKFARTMLGVLKITQDNNPAKWKYVPLQDFTNHSDIDWSKSIPEIDQQLYRKYGLSDEEINFIETHVKEME